MNAREELKAIRKKLGNLTEAEKAALTARAIITTIEGHTLSPVNRMMLYMTAASRGITPTVVGGYRQWQKAGKQVKKGEHGFTICVPGGIRKLADGTTVEDEDIFFLAATVFDISQTEPLDNKPKPGVIYALTGNNGNSIAAGKTWEESRTEDAIKTVIA